MGTYAKYDPRFITLVYAAKEWCGQNKVFSKLRLTSYACTLMVVHYLQTLTPPVLPRLQKLFLSKPVDTAEMVEYEVDGSCKIGKANVYFEKKLDRVKTHIKETNTSSTGELFTGFLIYYGFTFDVRGANP